MRGGFHVRVFLNSPQADVNTPTRGNDHYVGQISTFSGFCIGGPGHCDPPKQHRRKFDLRGRPHKTPGNFHLDATQAVQKLSAQGETAFQVNLVVINATRRRQPTLCCLMPSLWFSRNSQEINMTSTYKIHPAIGIAASATASSFTSRLRRPEACPFSATPMEP